MRWFSFRLAGGVAVMAGLLALTGCSPQLDSADEGIFVARPDGSGIVRIASDIAEPAWSPDGREIAYAGRDGVFIVTPDGLDRRKVSAIREAGPPAWSPQGDRLAFVDRATETLVVQPIAGGAAVTVALAPANGVGAKPVYVLRNLPSWSPDGKQNAFTSWDGNGDEIFVVDAAGGQRMQVTHTRLSAEPMNADDPMSPRKAQADAGAPDWSPTDDQIAFALYPETAGAQGGVYRIDPAGSRPVRLVGVAPRWGPVWSADGSSLLFAAARSNTVDLYLAHPDRWGAIDLTPNAGPPVASAAWGPDGRQIVVAAGGDLYRLDRESGTLTAIVQSSLSEATPAWSPDGSEIAFTRSLDLIGR
jgi:Tol biopolymer transport system component